ncbi:hypothetical protein ACQ4PT_058382 [Festuca glaucescens]
MQPPTAAVTASSLECVSSCRSSSWKVGGGGGRPYECSVLSCAWNAPRALTGALASTTQCSSCSHAEGLGGGRRRGRPRQGSNNSNNNTLVHTTWAEDINNGKLGHGSSASFVSSGEKFRSWSTPVNPAWRVSCHSSSDQFSLVSPETLWESLRPAISYLQPEELNFVHDALKLAYEAHNGQKRRSGEPFIIHPVEVARILGEHVLLFSMDITRNLTGNQLLLVYCMTLLKILTWLLLKQYKMSLGQQYAVLLKGKQRCLS